MKTLKHIAAHLLWLVNALFGLWLLFISRNTWLAAFTQYYIKGSPMRASRAVLFDRLFSIVLGVGWFLMVVALQPYINNGVDKGDYFRRFAKASGPIVLAFSGVDIILATLQGGWSTGALRWLIILVELVVGVLLVRYGRRKPARLREVGQI